MTIVIKNVVTHFTLDVFCYFEEISIGVFVGLYSGNDGIWNQTKIVEFRIMIILLIYFLQLIYLESFINKMMNV